MGVIILIYMLISVLAEVGMCQTVNVTNIQFVHYTVCARLNNSTYLQHA